MLKLPAPDKTADLLPTGSMQADAILKLSVFEDILTKLTKAFRLDINEVQRNPGGDLKVQVSDRQRYPNRQKDPMIVEGEWMNCFRSSGGAEAAAQKMFRQPRPAHRSYFESYRMRTDRDFLHATQARRIRLHLGSIKKGC